MATYIYKAQTGTGKTVTGKLAAQDENELHEKLQEQGRFLLSAKKETDTIQMRPLKARQISDFSREMGTMLQAGVSLIKALKILSEQEMIKPKEKMIYLSLMDQVKKGIPLSQAMEEQNGAFPDLLINMFHSAEVSGNLDKTCLRMAEHYEKEDRLNSKIKSSMVYPKILCVLLVLVVGVIMGYVIPQFDAMFAKMDSLPTATVVLLGISNFVKDYWLYILIFAVVFIFTTKFVLLVPSVKLAKDRLLLKIPLIGKLEKVIFTARFARTLSSLYSSGISIVTALQISKNTIGNAYIESQFDNMINDVRTGENLSDALAKVDGFTNKLISSIRIGEETGNLSSMLISTADSLDYDAEMATARMVACLEPAMIVLMAVIIGFIMIGVIKPIYGSYATIGKS